MKAVDHLLRTCELFAPLSQEERDLVNPLCTLQHVSVGQIVVEPEQSSDGFGLVVDGMFNLEWPKQDKVSKELRAGDYWGDLSLFCAQVSLRKVKISALTQGQVLKLSVKQFRELERHHPYVVQKVAYHALKRVLPLLQAAVEL